MDFTPTGKKTEPSKNVALRELRQQKQNDSQKNTQRLVNKKKQVKAGFEQAFVVSSSCLTSTPDAPNGCINLTYKNQT